MYCRCCGNKLEEGSKFCSKCGADNTQNPGKGRAIASLVLGILSLFLGVVFLPLPIIGLALGCSYKGKCGEKTAGIILNTLSLIISIVVIVLALVFGVIFGKKMLDKAIDNIDFNNINIQMNTDWEEYSVYVNPNDELDTTTNIVGNWKELSNNNRSYLVFSEEDYYFYEDINNMEAKYDTGKYTLENGFEELNQIGLKNNFFNKLMDKINTELENTSFSILKLDSKRSFENGVEVRTNLTEEETYGVVVITSHDGIVELIISGITNGEERHYYKVVKSNE